MSDIDAGDSDVDDTYNVDFLVKNKISKDVPKPVKKRGTKKKLDDEEFEEETVHRLPIKENGKWKGVVDKVKRVKKNVEDEEEDGEGEKEGPKRENIFLKPDWKKQLALKCMGVMESPEHRVSEIRSVQGMLDEGVNEEEQIPIALASITEVYKDIIPGYRIRKENEMLPADKHLKKHVKKAVEFEEALLSAYGEFLQLLEKHLEKNTEGGKYPQVALTCMGELLLKHDHFNFRANIISQLHSTIVSTKDGELREQGCEIFAKLFAGDSVGDCTLQAVELISKTSKNSIWKLNEPLLDTLLEIKIDENHRVILERLRNEKAGWKKLAKKERRRKKKLNAVEKELKATKAEQDAEVKAKLQGKILENIFSVYFRVMKSVGDCKSKKNSVKKLLPSVLKGVSAFGHMLNVEFYEAVFSSMHAIVANREAALQPLEQLYCVLTVFRLITGKGSTLNVDPERFYSQLLESLERIINHKGSNLLTPQVLFTLIECVRCGYIKRRKTISPEHVLRLVAALVKLANANCFEKSGNGKYAYIVLLVLKELSVSHQHVTRLFKNDDDDDEAWALAPGMTLGVQKSKSIAAEQKQLRKMLLKMHSSQNNEVKKGVQALASSSKAADPLDLVKSML